MPSVPAIPVSDATDSRGDVGADVRSGPPEPARALDIGDLLHEVGLDALLPPNPFRRVSLADAVELGGGAVDALGSGALGLERLEQAVSASFARRPAMRMLGLVGGIRPLYSTIYRTVLRPRWRGVFRSGGWKRSGRFELELELGPGAEPLLAIVCGLLRSLPHLVGGLDSRIEVLPVTSRPGRSQATPPAATSCAEAARSFGATGSLRVSVVPPASPVIWVRSYRWLRSWIGSRGMLDQLLYQQEQLVATYEQLRSAHEQLHRQSDALREVRARSAAVVENTTDLILICDAMGRASFANQAARRSLGRIHGCRLPIRMLDLVHPEDRHRSQRALAAAVRTDRSLRTEVRVQLSSSAADEFRWLEVSGQGFRTASGMRRVLITARDIGARKEADLQRQRNSDRLESEVRRRTSELQSLQDELKSVHRRLVDSQRMRAAQELAGNVAHAINNPLGALIGTVEMMLEFEKDPDPRLERIHHLAHRIRAVVGRVLQLSREGTLKFALEDPGVLLHEVYDEISERARKQQVELELEVPPDLPHAYADRTLLRAALVAVAENAIDASPAGGRVWLSIQRVEVLGLVEFRIRDSGPGVPQAIRERIFEPFFSTKGAGTGLGLSIALGIILGHEGRIQFSDAEEGGALATIEIPLQVTKDSQRNELAGIGLNR